MVFVLVYHNASLGGLFLLCEFIYFFGPQIENEFSPLSKQTEIERRSGQRREQTVDSRALWVCG